MKSLLLTFFLLLLTLAQPAFAYKLIYENIDPDLFETTKSRLGINTNNVSLKEVDELIRGLSSTQKFSSVFAIKVNSRTIKLQADEIKKISRLNFVGNSEFSDSKLKEVTQIFTGQRLERQKVNDGIQYISQLYKKAGYLKAKITTDIQTPRRGQAYITYNIEENQSSQLTSINFAVENADLKKNLESLTTKYLGKPLSEDLQSDLIETIESFLATRRFLTAQVSEPQLQLNSDQTSATMTIPITFSYKYEVIFYGNKNFDSLQLYKELSLTDFDKNKNPTSFIFDKTRQFYLSRGFANVKVKINEELNKKQNKMWLKVFITEGPEVSISSITINGRISRPQSYYVHFIKANSSPLIAKMLYNAPDFSLGVSNLTTHLQNTGYLKAKSTSIRVDKNKTGSEVKLTVYIDEGPLTHINKIQFTGNKSYGSELLTQTLGLKKGDPLNSNKLTEGLKKLEQYYVNHGFIEMKILNSGRELLEYSPDGTIANIKVNLYEGPLVTVRSIIIEGNTFTKDYVILTEIPLKKGDVVTQELLETSRNRLNNLGIFNLVQVSTLEKNSKISERTLIISIVEREPGRLRFGIGVTSEYDLTYRGYLGISYNNLSGTARSLSFRADLLKPSTIDATTSKFTLGYLEPFLNNERIRGSVNIKRLQLLSNIEDNDASVSISNSLSLGVELDLKKHTNLSWTVYKLDFTESFKLIAANKTETQVATMGPVVTFDNRDSPFLPTEGHYGRFLFEYSSPNIGSFDGNEFYKVDLNFRHYIKIRGSKDVILAFNLGGGYLENLSEVTDSGVPKDYSFALGGRSTIRGFDANSKNDRLLPEDELSSDGDSVNNYIQNSQSYQLLKTELRFTLYEDFGGVLFYDAGSLYAKGVSQEHPFRHTAGFGLRYNTPFGPVSFEFGFKLNGPYHAEEDSSRFHFSIGAF